MKTNRTLYYLLIAIATILSIGCEEALRDNPSDPGSDRYFPFGSLSITTTIRRATSDTVIAGINISVNDRILQTDSSGRAFVSNMAAGTYTLILSSPFYVSDTTSVTILAGERTYLTRQLNAIPIFDTLAAFTQLKPGPSSPRLSSMHFFAKVRDPDNGGTRQAVGVETPYGYLPLSYLGGSSWGLTIDTLFHSYFAFDLIGTTMQFRAVDDTSLVRPGIALSQAIWFTRVFNEIPTIITASGTQMPLTQCNISWGNSARDFFSFHMRIILQNQVQTSQVYTIDNVPKSPQNISRNLKSLWPAIVASTYLLTVEEVDAYGNYSTSQPIVVNLN